MEIGEGVFQFTLSAFITLMVVVDPFGIVPIFVGLTRRHTPAQRRRILLRAVMVAFGVSMFFLVLGKTALHYLGITVHAFGISGGILLFGTALPMLFGQRPGLQAPDQGENRSDGDISIFPLGIPLLSGPGTITTILLLTSEAGASASRNAVLAGVVAVTFAVTLIILAMSDRVVSRMGESGVHIATRVMGIVVAAIAVQFVLNGLGGYYAQLTGS